MVGTEEGVEPEFLGEPRDREEIVVARTFLRFCEDSEAHEPVLSHW